MPVNFLGDWDEYEAATYRRRWDDDECYEDDEEDIEDAPPPSNQTVEEYELSTR